MNTGDRAMDAMLGIVAVALAALAGALLGFLASALDQQGHVLTGAMIAAWLVTREVKRFSSTGGTET